MIVKRVMSVIKGDKCVAVVTTRCIQGYSASRCASQQNKACIECGSSP